MLYKYVSTCAHTYMYVSFLSNWNGSVARCTAVILCSCTAVILWFGRLKQILCLFSAIHCCPLSRHWSSPPERWRALAAHWLLNTALAGSMIDRAYLQVSWNRGTPKSSIFMAFSIINHPFGGTPIYGNHHCWSLKTTGSALCAILTIRFFEGRLPPDGGFRSLVGRKMRCWGSGKNKSTCVEHGSVYIVISFPQKIERWCVYTIYIYTNSVYIYKAYIVYIYIYSIHSIYIYIDIVNIVYLVYR